MEANDWFLQAMESERQRFELEQVFLPSRIPRFERWNALLSESPASFKQRSPPAQSVRKHTRLFLADINAVLGLEITVLCASATSMTKLRTVDSRSVIPSLERWWDSKAHPQSLKVFSTVLDQKFDLQQLLGGPRVYAETDTSREPTASTANKRKLSEADRTFK